ncbi:Pkinase-domain-containing protein [Westerdykella ornata]|uniref:non-specific serine/threonine protein kinase n=1 Tax=Westerdykella ornata TaxID=318751 RepID=A0A6A6JYE2_WESOR|nr:Pkinase-domain-containing protein [Westerdykella ornata]KAF2281244.1 Pkinase-domain-containing protein [Westerdykella ornata]
MDRSSLQPPSNVGTKARAIQQAKEMEKLVAERAKRTGDEPPPYDFFELIGKGAYGRVFKGRNRATGGLVAIKIIDIDKTDYEEMTTKNLQETLREINILQQLKDSRARPYVNIIEEARTVHNELWIVSEYASGGSVHTLMKPRLQQLKTGIEEKYIIPIARELALGLKFIHEAGVIHRDLKSNNILILEDGRVQLCDFGVSGALEPEITKRSTIVGTPNWMAPELQREWVKDLDPSRGSRPNDILYGSEVDIWAYGCTLYEMATGFPPFHQTQPFLLPDAGVPVLEGDQYSDELKSLVSFVLQPNPRDRPTPDQILQHPYIVDSTKMHPTVTLVALVEQYYRWEQAGGSRVSLFNPYGAQAPDPLAPEPEEEEDDDWTFSTTDEFDKQFANEHSDPFSGGSSTSNFPGMNAPPEDDSRFAKLQASIRAEQAERGKKRLDRLFDTNSTPYRFSTVDSDSNRLSSDLVLRDFNPGAPNRETVIDLDFAAPTAVDIPSIDLGEVPTVKASRINRLMRDMDEEEEQEYIDLDNTARRDTREWKFPSAIGEQSPKSQTFSSVPRDRNSRRKTMEWKFDFSQLAAEPEPLPNAPRLSRRRDTRDWVFPRDTTSTKETSGSQDFVFPPREIDEPFGLSSEPPELSSSPTLGPDRRPSLRHAVTEPYGVFDDYPPLQPPPDSPLRTSMINLDVAVVDKFRPSTSGSTSTTASTSRGQENRNPFDLEDQVTRSEPNKRASYHMKSQSEPQHHIPGLLTPQVFDEQGNPTIQDHTYTSMHARGVSSVSQMQPRPAPDNLRYPRQRSQHLVPQWDTWSHQDAFLTQTSSSPVSVSPSTSVEEEERINIDDRWDKLERQVDAFQYQRNGGAGGGGSRQFSGGYFRSSRRTTSTDIDDRSDADDSYASLSESGFDDGGMTVRPGPTAASGQQRGTTRVNIASRLSVGPGGKPMLDFPIPRGPDLESLLRYGGVVEGEGERDAEIVSRYADALWKGAKEMTEGLRASRSLLRSMRLAEMEVGAEEEEEE